MFLGTTFFCGKHTLLPPATNVNNIRTVTLSDGKYDHLYITADPTKTSDNIYDEWDFDTLLNASFESDLRAGNTDFTVRNTDTIVIKTREKGTFEWKTIYTVPISKEEDFNFIKNYPFSRNLSDNEYMMISTINGIENFYVIEECRTEFEGYFIVDKKNIYGTMFNIQPTDTVQNINDTTLELLNSKYPTVYTYSDSNYTTGSTSGCFLKFNMETCEIDFDAGLKYRHEVMQWICIGKPKILKLEDGRIYLIKVVGKPTDTNEGHIDLRRISFDWVEIGDVNDVRTLYMNNLSDVTEAYW